MPHLRVLLLADSYYPVSNSCSRQMHDLAVEITRRGHEVILLTASPHISEDVEVSANVGFSVVRVRTGPMKAVSRLERGLTEIRLSNVFWSKAGPFLRQHKCDLIAWYSPSIFFGRLVQRLKREWSCPAYLILRDIFPEWAIDTGVLRSRVLSSYFRRRAKEQYQVADIVGVESASSIEYFRHCYPTNESKIEVLANWISATPEVDGPAFDCYRKRLGLEGKTVFFYGGNIGIAQDVDCLIRLARRLVSRADIHFVIVGQGSESLRIRQAADQLGLKNVLFVDPLSEKEYGRLLTESDVGVLTLNGDLRSRNVPGKLLSYLRMGKPVLASLNPHNEVGELIKDSGVGLCSLAGEDDKLLANTLRLADNSELRTRMGSAANDLLRAQFNVAKAATQVLSLAGSN